MAKVLERSLYQTDYYAWTKQQAAELRRLASARADSTLDLANLAEEVESLGISQLSSVKSQMRRVMEHLLKLEHSPEAEPRGGWRRTIIEARDEISDDLTAALRRDVEAALALLYEQSRRRARVALAAHGERAAAQALPVTCPYSFDQIVSHDWYPANRHGIVDDIADA
jgi:Domain of unknown function DUF29